MATRQPFCTTNAGKGNEFSGKAANQERSDSTTAGKSILKGMAILPKSRYDSGFLSKSPFPTATTEKRLPYSNVVRRGSLDDKPSKMEVAEAFERLSLRLSDRNYNRESVSYMELKPQMNDEDKMPFEGFDSTRQKLATRKVTYIQKSNSETNLHASKTATIISAQHGSLKMSFDDVSRLPLDTKSAPVSPIKKSQVMLESPEYFVPPKWFPKTSVLYKMYSKPRLPHIQVSKQTDCPNPTGGVGIIPNYQKVGHFPIIRIVPVSSVIRQQCACSPSKDMPYSSEHSTKTPEAAIKEAFSAHYARQRRQSVVDPISRTVPTYAPLWDESRNRAGSSFKGLSNYQDVDSRQIRDNFFQLQSSSIVNPLPEPPKIPDLENNSSRLANTPNINIEESEADESGPSKTPKLIKSTFSELKNSQKRMEKLISDGEEIEHRNGFDDVANSSSIKNANLFGEKEMVNWLRQSQDRQICDCCRYWKKLKAENPSVDISEQLLQRLSAFQNQTEQDSGEWFDRCTRCSRKLTKKIASMLCEKQGWKQQCNQRGA